MSLSRGGQLMPKSLPSPDFLRTLLRYEPDTGNLFWRPRARDMFATETHQRRWNTKYAGKPALAVTDKDGYLYGTLRPYRNLRAHRVIWALVHGNWPKGQIDHINGVKDDNRIANLRDVTGFENQQNRRSHKPNLSGRVGVYYRPKRNQYQATINHDGKFHHLGCYEKFEDAVMAREEAERRLGFHKNHGRRI